MKTAIVYASVHHRNTKKIVDAIAASSEVEIIDATQVKEKDLSGYDRIGFVSGIYYGNDPSQELLDKVHADKRMRVFEYQISYTER